MSRRIILNVCFLILLAVLLSVPVRAADQNSQAAVVGTSGSRLNVRSSPSAGASVVERLNNGSYVTLIARSGSWWRVEYADGKYGYCHSDYISVVSGSPAVVSTRSSALNVRRGPGTSYAKVGSVSKGKTVIVLSTSSGWSKILYNGSRTGYVSAQYLSGYYGAVSLNVPSFKQMDSRWADTMIGTSGRTMAQIGCATTAVAMMESSRTGSTIYPDVMSKNLRYTPDGSLYWPANYTAVTDGSGYLNDIYTHLRVGRPVLFGARNSYGKQHWVVITGFSGGASLKASAFRINDPGSNSRVTLQQFLNEYPTFYKYFHY